MDEMVPVYTQLATAMAPYVDLYLAETMSTSREVRTPSGHPELWEQALTPVQPPTWRGRWLYVVLRGLPLFVVSVSQQSTCRCDESASTYSRHLQLSPRQRQTPVTR